VVEAGGCWVQVWNCGVQMTTTSGEWSVFQSSALSFSRPHVVARWPWLVHVDVRLNITRGTLAEEKRGGDLAPFAKFLPSPGGVKFSDKFKRVLNEKRAISPLFLS
jgi:hypothetical protein